MGKSEGLARRLREVAKKIRPHASFFEWPDKEVKELGVVRALIEAVGPPLSFVEVRPGKPDPPDAIGKRGDGGLVAIEVTELIDQQVTEHNVQAMRQGKPLDTVYRVWDRPSLIAAVEERLWEKDGAKLNGGPFEDYVVAIHTDELALAHGEVQQWLDGHAFTGFVQVTEAYLLFSFDSVDATAACPYVRLNVG